MYITREEYEKYGYAAVPEAEFGRYAYNAEAVVRRCTFDRIADADLRPEDTTDAKAMRVAEMNQRGVCEMVDALWAREKVTVGEAGAAIKSFTNEGYSETLDTSGQSAEELHRRIWDIMHTYFTAAQMYRGVV